MLDCIPIKVPIYPTEANNKYQPWGVGDEIVSAEKIKDLMI